MKMHDLKTWPEYFDAIISGAKLFEVRKDDRGFTVGDTLLLREWDPKHSWYTGRTVSRRVTYVLTGPAFGIEAGFVCMGIIEAELSKQKPVARPRLPRIDHFAREAFEKFASGVECELTNYRWFEAGWDARGDTVAAAPLPSAPDTVQVPREPTQDMLYAMAELDGWKRGDREHPMLTRWEDYWVAALAAAPKSTP